MTQATQACSEYWIAACAACGTVAASSEAILKSLPLSASVPDLHSLTSSSLSLNLTYASSPIAAPQLHIPLALDLFEFFCAPPSERGCVYN